MFRLQVGAFALAAALGATAAWAQSLDVQDMKVQGKMEQVSTHMGAMSIQLGENAPEINDRLIFEPYQMNDELQKRTDLVFLMRHGPTDWSKLDEKNVAPTDCANQRIMSPEGRKKMETLGLLLGSNLLLPSKIMVSEWCRNQQTLESLNVGFDQVADDLSEAFVVETNPELNLLLSLQGAEDVEELRKIISNWDGNPPEGSPYKGRLLIITHFTNIEELTNFQVFEGEILVVDPKRDNRVIGYLRLASASPDVGHFNQ